MKWTTKDGQRLNIKEMSDEHIINTMKWLINDPCFGTLDKDSVADTYWISILANELNRRRDRIQDFVESIEGEEHENT